MPRVTGPEMADAAIRSMLVEPHGRRGMGVTSRAGRWGIGERDAYVRHGLEGIVRAIQIEDRGALAAIGAIVATPELGMVAMVCT